VARALFGGLMNVVNLEPVSRIARMIERRIHTQLVETIGRYPAVALLGPRPVGNIATFPSSECAFRRRPSGGSGQCSRTTRQGY
jgi:hypothetical protein